MTYPNPNIPLQPPREWFTPPADMPSDAGCIVEANGRIYGYICHFGAVLMGGQTDKWTPPRSRTQYAYAHTGDTMLDDGSTIKTANLGGDAGHASVDLSDPERLSKLQDYYENTSTQLARVRYGEDANGVWFAGSCWPTVTDLDIAKLRASARSGHWAAIGDWRDIRSGRNGYELVGACLVNVPGLKYARADKAASGVLMLSPFVPTESTVRDDIREAVRTVKAQVDQLALAVGGDMTQLATRTQTQIDKVASSGTVEFASESGVNVGGVLVIEGQQTEDGRFIEAGAISHRELPLPLYAKLPNTGGHDDAQLVGTIGTISDDTADSKVKRYTGTIYPDYADGYGAKTLQAIADGALRGISVDGIAGPDDGFIDQDDVWHMTKLIIGGGTLTPMPAFENATVEIGDSTSAETDSADVEASATVSLSSEGANVDTDEAAVDDGNGESTTTDAENDATPATADQVAAVSDKLDAALDAIAQLTSLIEGSQMSARLSAVRERELSIAKREKELGL